MFKWFSTWLHAWQKPTPLGDIVVQRTIDQICTCRGHLAALMEEARLARQMLATVETEIEEERRRVKQRQTKEPVAFTNDERQRA